MNTRNIYLVCLIFICLILIYINYSSIFPLFEGISPAPAVEMTETQATINNKQMTGDITMHTANSKLSDINSKIQECQTLINNINAILPRSIENIHIGTIDQTDDVNQVSARVLPSTTTITDPITGDESRTGIWTIDMVLPKGKQGPQGPQGLMGKTGEQGDTGTQGKHGLQGPWGTPEK